MKHIKILFLALWIISCGPLFSQVSGIAQLKLQLQKVVSPYKASVGIAVTDLETGDTLTIHTHQRCVMQSVFKFPLAIAVLRGVDEKRFILHQKIHISKEDLKPNTWSPIRTQYPDGNVDLPLSEILKYTVSQSDNNGCDILFKLMGGTANVNAVFHGLGVTNMQIVYTEDQMHQGWAPQFSNWSEPMAMNMLLQGLYQKRFLSDSSNLFLMDIMKATSTGPLRLKGLLPKDIIVAHKTGTSGDNDSGLTAAVNDVGILFMPDGKAVALSVFVNNTREKFETNEKIIALISKTVFDFYMRQTLIDKIDALLSRDTQHLFNGILLVTQNGKPLVSKIVGVSDREKMTPLKMDDQFVIGSVSKQFTAAMVMLEMERGHLKLDVPIHTYLPDLKFGWADTVTVHHLLTHTHGLVDENKPSTFPAGSKMDYSNGNDVGYYLLSKVIEKTSGKSFVQLSTELFEKCKMTRTFHPENKGYKALAKGYMRQGNGEWKVEDTAWTTATVPAGGFISTAHDLIVWDQQWQGGKLLKKETYALMIAKKENIIRQHPVFGLTEYGYGLTVRNTDNILRLGQTGLAPGFVSMNFYFPQSKTGVVVLSNGVNGLSDIKQTFYYHAKVLEIVQNHLLQK